ncbi:MAG: BC1881 family protein [Cetobacterium sp.]|uniref:BC1881 family protein n=1 Tax=Cetobacterium sp. TaxID=2071632 RepID=UPI003F2B5A42
MELKDIKTCELVEELKRREGVEYAILENSDFECEIRTPRDSAYYDGPGTTILIIED